MPWWGFAMTALLMGSACVSFGVLVWRREYRGPRWFVIMFMIWCAIFTVFDALWAIQKYS